MHGVSGPGWSARIIPTIPPAIPMNEVVHLPTRPRGYDLGTLVRIERAGRATIVAARKDDIGPTALIAGPPRETITLLSQGEGYRIPIENPKDATQLDGGPILAYHTAPDGELLWYHDFTTVYAVDRSGPLWRSEALVPDDLEVTAWLDDRIEGKGVAIPGTGDPVHFVLDARTGRVLAHEDAYPSDFGGPADRHWIRPA